ncbi:MAG: S-layer homology domain-containing protein [Eubacteriales bacterium]|nr:S-layer homology domain-containing protein [Eubacteriales bacterium]
MKQSKRKIALMIIIMLFAINTLTYAQTNLSLVSGTDSFSIANGNAIKITSKDTQIIEKIRASGKTGFNEGFYSYYEGGARRSSDQYLTVDVSGYSELVFDVVAISKDQFGDLEAFIKWQTNPSYYAAQYSSYENYLSTYTFAPGSGQPFNIANGSRSNPLSYLTEGFNIYIHNSTWQIKHAVTVSNQWQRVALDISGISTMNFQFSINGAGNILVANPYLIKSAPTGTASPSFWAIEGVADAKELSIITQNTSQGYTNFITRKEFTEVIINLYEAVRGVPDDLPRITFSDTTSREVEIAAALGLVNGIGNNLFAPNALITREQIVTIFDRLLTKLDITYPVSTDYIRFVDENLISDWAKPSVQMLYKLGILQGVSEAQIAPKSNATKEQSLILSVRLYDLLNQ